MLLLGCRDVHSHESICYAALTNYDKAQFWRRYRDTRPNGLNAVMKMGVAPLTWHQTSHKPPSDMTPPLARAATAPRRATPHDAKEAITWILSLRCGRRLDVVFLRFCQRPVFSPHRCTGNELILHETSWLRSKIGQDNWDKGVEGVLTSPCPSLTRETVSRKVVFLTTKQLPHASTRKTEDRGDCVGVGTIFSSAAEDLLLCRRALQLSVAVRDQA